VNSIITRLSGDAAALPAQNNALQAIAERTRLGIPVTISTDPRNLAVGVLFVVFGAWQFSKIEA
jgi:hypothetical protein